MRADLHVHSNASDGTDDPATVMRNAAAAGLDAVALTDHDTTAGHAVARAALPEGLTLIPGMELSCHLNDRSVHLLAYLFDPGDVELAEQTRRIRDDRVIRAQAIVTKLAELGADVTWEQVTAIAGSSVVGRPHIARAMVAAGIITEPRDAFTSEWIADDGRAYVTKYALDPVHAIGLIKAAGGVAVLAHPRAGRAWDLSDAEITGLAAAGLAGVEVAHPDHDLAERQALLRLATALDLLATAGSDNHGSFTGGPIGSETVDADTLTRLESLGRVP
ncbi:MAG TPA: PHP domain-containing protein [Streptosporangiaceae bacterium]|nr:PHP domain-containing protein [Streptosporangiaceae bacterium]